MTDTEITKAIFQILWKQGELSYLEKYQIEQLVMLLAKRAEGKSND